MRKTSKVTVVFIIMAMVLQLFSALPVSAAEADPVIVLTEISIVSGFAANIPVKVTGVEATNVSIQIFDLEKAVVNGMIRLAANEVPSVVTATPYPVSAKVNETVTPLGAITVVPLPDKLWELSVVPGVPSTMLLFAARISGEQIEVLVDGSQVAHEIIPSEHGFMIDSAGLVREHEIVVKKVQFNDLFPSFRFTFTAKHDFESEYETEYDYDYAFESGSQLWMRYTSVIDDALMSEYQQAASSVVVQNYDQNKLFRATENLSMYDGSKEKLVETTLEAARNELIRGIGGLFGTDKKLKLANTVKADGAIVVGTPSSSAIIASLNLGDALAAVGEEGYIIKSMAVDGFQTTVIAANEDLGALYGTFHFLRLMQTQKSVLNLNITESPKVKNRHLNNWETTRLYAGNNASGSGGLNGENGTIFNFSASGVSAGKNLPVILDRYIVFARACASLGINGIEVNLVNANDQYLGAAYIAREAALADALRPYGVRIALAINYTAPTSTNAALDASMRVATNDPYSADFQNWWTYKAIQLTDAIPDFIGFTVKANSEGQPGPQTYGYNHGDGANGIAEAVSFKGDFSFKGMERKDVDLDLKILWRTFVYNANVDPDRLNRAHMEFGFINDDVLRGGYLRNEAGNYLDAEGNDIGTTGIIDGVDKRYKPPILDEDGKTIQGGFRSNAFIQTKTGPLDYQGREPFHPMFGLMDNTVQAMEMQVTQEYMGQSTMLTFLAPMWEEILKAETYAIAYQKDVKGNYILDETGNKIVKATGAKVGEIVDGSFQGQPDSFMVGVANVGNHDSMCGHQFSQSNFFAFGRQSWNWNVTSEEIADDWVRMTWSNEQDIVDTITEMIMGSWEALVSYQTPLGVGHQFTGNHYAPGPSETSSQDDWGPAYYNKVDSAGLGYNRTTEGSNMVSPASRFVTQYFEPLRSQFNNIDTTPENLLMWFHHVPWDRKMSSGRLFWDELVYRYQMGVQYVTWMRETWNSLESFFAANTDTRRFTEVQGKLTTHERDAANWRDTCIAYWQNFNDLPIPTDDGPLSIKIVIGGKTIGGFNLSVDTFAASSVPKAYSVKIPFGAVPTITGVIAADGVRYEILKQAESISDTAIIKASKDDFFGPIVKNYNIGFTYDASLSDLKVGGVSLSAFNPDVTSYSLLTMAGPAPAITATAADAHATVEIVQAEAVPGSATITVTNESVTTVYTLNFSTPMNAVDNFEAETLGAQWSWIRENSENWSLSRVPGALTINTRNGDLQATANTAENILLQDVAGYSWQIESKVTFSKQLNSPYEQAGIIAYADDNNYLKLAWECTGTSTSVTAKNRRPVLIREQNGTATTVQFTQTQMSNAVGANDSVWFKMIKTGNTYKCYYSFDGVAYKWLGNQTLNVEPAKAGILAFNRTGNSTDLFASFDYFKAFSVGNVIG